MGILVDKTTNILKTYRGDSGSFTIKIKAGEVAVNLTGATIRFTTKMYGKSTHAISKNITEHIDSINGITKIILTKTDTNIPAGTYDYDIEVAYSNGNVDTLVKSKFVVLQDVSI